VGDARLSLRSLGWSEANTGLDAPLLASSSVEGIVVWSKQTDESLGWSGRVLTIQGVVQAISFQPSTFLLASAAEDGRVCLWHKAKRCLGSRWCSDGFSCLAWHPKVFAAGGQNGELLVWSKSMGGKDLVIA